MMRLLFACTMSLALASCTSWATRDPERGDLHLRIGSSLLENGKYPQALSELLLAEDADPESAVIQNNLALAYLARERFDLAEKHLRRSLQLDSKFTEARSNLGRVFIEQKKYSEAEQVLLQASQDLTFPFPEKIYLNLGLSHFRQGKFQSSKNWLMKSLDLKKDNCTAQTLYGRSFYELKDFSAAAANLDRATGFCSNGQIDEAQYYSALAYFQIGDSRKAELRLEEIVKLYQNGKFYDRARAMLETMRK